LDILYVGIYAEFILDAFNRFQIYTIENAMGSVGEDDDKSSLFSHDQRLAQGEEAMVTT
jgi:hypothetical protein